MFKVSDILTTPPPAFSSELQQKVYETFAALDIPFERVDTDPGITIFASICWQSSIVIPGSVSTRSKGMSSAAKAA